MIRVLDLHAIKIAFGGIGAALAAGALYVSAQVVPEIPSDPVAARAAWIAFGFIAALIVSTSGVVILGWKARSLIQDLISDANASIGAKMDALAQKTDGVTARLHTMNTKLTELLVDKRHLNSRVSILEAHAEKVTAQVNHLQGRLDAHKE